MLYTLGIIVCAIVALASSAGAIWACQQVRHGCRVTYTVLHLENGSVRQCVECKRLYFHDKPACVDTNW